VKNEKKWKMEKNGKRETFIYNHHLIKKLKIVLKIQK